MPLREIIGYPTASRRRRRPLHGSTKPLRRGGDLPPVTIPCWKGKEEVVQGVLERSLRCLWRSRRAETRLTGRGNRIMMCKRRLI